VVIEETAGELRVVGSLGADSALAPFAVRHDAGVTRVGLPAVEGTSRHLHVEAQSLPLAAPADDSPWAAGMIRAGESWITAATQDQFVPQMVNLDALGGINFKKGCYRSRRAACGRPGALLRRSQRAGMRPGRQRCHACGRNLRVARGSVHAKPGRNLDPPRWA